MEGWVFVFGEDFIDVGSLESDLISVLENGYFLEDE